MSIFDRFLWIVRLTFHFIFSFENLEENSAQVEDEEESEVPTNTVFLTPKPLMRQNFCQLRGSSFPKWFPGKSNSGFQFI